MRTTIAQQLDRTGFKCGAQQQLNNKIKQDSNGAHNNSLTLR